MDEEKFSLERFLELMGERGDAGREKVEDRAVGRDILRARAIGRKPRWKDETPEGAGDTPERGKRSGLLGRAVERVRRTFVRKADEAVDLDRSRDRNSDRFREAKSRPILHGREGRSSARTVDDSGLRSDLSSRGFHVEQSVETDVRDWETAENAEQVGARVEREWHEDEVPRARSSGRVWQGVEVERTGRARNRRWTEDGLSDEREGRAKRVWGETRDFAESDSNFAKSRGKIAEFRKSDVSVGVDLRAISRAIERDARRY